MSDAIRSNTLESDTNDTLPVGWRQASLAEVAEIRISNVDKKSAVGEIPVRLCNYIDVYKNVYITAALDFMEATATPSEIARFCVDLGDVMITKDSETPDDIGVPAVAIWSDPKLVCGYHLALFKPHRDQIDPVFLAKQLRLPRIAAYYGRLACGSTRYGLSNSGIARTPLRFPPLPHQRKIARILTTVDNLIEKTEALIAKYQAIKQGMMHDLFTRGVNEHGHLRPPFEEAPELYKQSELGWIPKEWEAHNLGAVASLQVGYAFKSSWFRDDGGFRLLRGENVGYGRPDWSDAKFLASTMAQQFNEYTLQTGDVVIGMDRTFTKTGVKITQMRVEDCPALLVQRVGRFLPRQCESDFLRTFLGYERYHADLARQQKGMDIPHLSQTEILEPLIPLPPKDEQHRISARLATLEASISSECENLEKMNRYKTGLMQDLLTGKVRVKVDEDGEVAAHA